MKKVIKLLTVIAVVMSLMACSGKSGTLSETERDTQNPSGQTETEETPQNADGEDSDENTGTFSGDTGSMVYMTKDILPDGLMKVYEALEWEPRGNVAVKLSTGEPPASNYLEPALIKNLVQKVKGTIVECNMDHSQ